MGDFLSKLVSEMQGRQLSAYPIEHGRHERFVRSLYNKDMTAGLAYWKDLLQDYETQAAIPAYRKPTEAEVKNAVPRISSVLDAGMTDSLQSLAAKAHCTLNTVMELAWGLTLHACCRTNDAVFAKVVSGRSGTDMKTDGIVGLFINSVPVRVRTGENSAGSGGRERSMGFLSTRSDTGTDRPGTGTLPVDDGLRELSRSAGHGRDTGGMELQTRTDRGGTV